MNYRNACLKSESESVAVKTNPKSKPKTKTNKQGQEQEQQQKERERVLFNRSCAKAVNTLYLRWTQYKVDYIALHGEDEYERMYLTPNYWVLPEDEDEWESEEEREREREKEREDDYYYSS